MVSLHRLRRRASVARELERAMGQARRAGGSAQLRALAAELRQLKLELAERASAGRTCGRCARGIPDVPGCFDGGLCCSGNVLDVFTPHAIAALALTGTRARDLRDSQAGAGCVFRGPRGCSLDLEHRPPICVHYICRDLMEELAEDRDTRSIAALQDRLAAVMTAFAELYDRERGDAELDELVPW